MKAIEMKDAVISVTATDYASNVSNENESKEYKSYQNESTKMKFYDANDDLENRAKKDKIWEYMWQHGKNITYFIDLSSKSMLNNNGLAVMVYKWLEMCVSDDTLNSLINRDILAQLACGKYKYLGSKKND